MLLIATADTTLQARERAWIADPVVSGLTLFTRNFQSRSQVARLIDEIRAVRPGPFLICVDQEGGPVQRFREGFTRLPALARLGDLWDADPQGAVALTEEHAWLMASEMRAIGIDLSFAPVADLKRGNRAIGERAFHVAPAAVSELTLAYVRGMHLAGMAATIKHFPGHGSVLEDTHFAQAIDRRSFDQILADDLLPFQDAFQAGADAVMMAHVTYPAVDPAPAGYSHRWIVDILRGDMGFRGAVFSDDIGMAAAESAGGVAARIAAHVEAGCDFVLACQPALIDDCLRACVAHAPADPAMIERLSGRVAQTWDALADNPQREAFSSRLAALKDKASA